MRNLLFNSLLIPVILLIAACSYSSQNNTETVSEDSVAAQVPDTTLSQKTDSVIPVTIKPTPVQAEVSGGDTVSAQSTRTESTEPGTTSKHPGAISNPGANQSQTDSIKKIKTKGKKKN
ncbi:MAG: hypothetical protein JXA23_03155 [Bacteroidales bacterium]|nr:hypothetical protein [Bacteroidales bacterium]